MEKKYKYKFSIVMSIYKTDTWLREAVDSIIHQDIGFEDNVQIILVNDGSPDNSEEICLEYQERFPNNIVYKKKKNGGLSSARNFGIKFREGEYINFFDPDDILEHNVLSEVYKFSQKHKAENLALITIPLVYFEAQEGLHKKYEFMGDKNRVINLLDEPYNFVLSSAGSFYKSEVFNSSRYDPTVHTAEDTDVNFRLYIDRPSIGYVVEKGVKYNYRKRFSGGSMVDSISKDVRGLTSVVKVFENILKLKPSEHMEFVSQGVIYELRTRVRLLDESLFQNRKEYQAVIDDYRMLIKSLPVESILKSKYLHSDQLKYIFLSNINERQATTLSPDGDLMLEDGLNTKIRVKPVMKTVDVVSGRVIMEFLVFDYNLQDLNLVFIDKISRRTIKPSVSYSTTTSHDLKLGNHAISETRYLKFEIPTNTASYAFTWVGDSVEGDEGVKVKPNMFQYLPFKLYTKRAAFIKSNVGVSVDGKVFHVYEAGRASFYKHALAVTVNIVRKHKKIPLTRILGRYEKKYVLISDRPYIARDNGEALFTYINSKESTLAKDTYYVLDRKSDDYRRLQSIGKVVRKDSLKHKFLFINSKMVLSSHLHPSFILPFKHKEYKFLGDIMNHKFVWLQHGVTMNNISNVANRFHQGVDGVVVASRIEKEIFSQKKYFYNPENILNVGFPRFDYNTDKAKKVITIIPTWRKYIASTIDASGVHKKIDHFETTEFFIKYAELLSDKKLHDKLKQSGVKLNFVLHPGLMRQIDSFYPLQTGNVAIIPPQDTDYRRIFSESSLLITDYSSVFFDFSYMYKPTLFYQFDKNRFFADHYEQSELFSYEKNGTGEVLTEHDQIVSAIISSIDSGFAISSKYKRRIDKLFLHHDRSNSQRLIKTLKDKNYL